MNKNKLNYPYLGESEIIEVFDYFDYPIVYVIQTKHNGLFLFQVIKEENSIKEIVVSGLTREKLSELKSNMITLQSTYNDPSFSYFLLSKNE
jgi:hypothetical protein